MYQQKAFVHIVDAVSISLVDMASCSDSTFQQEVDAYMNLFINNLIHLCKRFFLNKMKTQCVKSLKHTLKKGSQTNSLSKDPTSHM